MIAATVRLRILVGVNPQTVWLVLSQVLELRSKVSRRARCAKMYCQNVCFDVDNSIDHPIVADENLSISISGTILPTPGWSATRSVVRERRSANTDTVFDKSRAINRQIASKSPRARGSILPRPSCHTPASFLRTDRLYRLVDQTKNIIIVGRRVIRPFMERRGCCIPPGGRGG